MRSTVHSVHALSPESTVTSLLSSSGHLTSNLQPPTLSQSFSYKDKEYISASAALDAYITDFERSRRGNTLSGVELVLPSAARGSALGTLRNRDVLRERLTERELDILSLPVSSLRHRGNRDRVSMTTDELISLPHDGSMPITHTTAFLHGLSSKSGVSHSRSPVKTTCCQSHAPRAGHPIRTLRCSRCGGGLETTTRSQGAGPASAPRTDWPSGRDQATMHLPHWLSSNKAAVDCSDVHSLPDLPYPPWIRHCHADQSERGYGRGSQSERSYNDQGQSQGGEIEDFPASAPSWVLELEDDQQQLDSELSLKNLRLQFAEHISHLASGRTDSAHSLYREQRIQSLIHKADQVLDSLQNSASGSPLPPASVDRTDELHLRDLDPGPSRAEQRSSAAEPQPGPLEAFKQMLFRLEAVETELHHRHHAQQGAPQDRGQQGAPQDSEQQGQRLDRLRPKETEVTDDQNPEADGGGPSLQRALLHLHRLKLLVDKTQTCERAEEDERDEGRYSSSSTEQQQQGQGGAVQDTERLQEGNT
uniref:Lung adenoma susceptibility protein 2 n=1 Tax=Neogobius melanostomus TaxID=47308 RepID=A0A8C6UV35_9GOBI